MNLFFQRTAIQLNCCSSPETLTHTVLDPSEKSLEVYESEVSLFFAIIVATKKLTNCNGSQFLSAFTKFREGLPLFPFSFSFFSFSVLMLSNDGVERKGYPPSNDSA